MQSYERMRCRTCGGHWFKARDKTLARDVRDVEDVCLDCEAIQQVWTSRHAKHANHPEQCDCDKRHVFVAEHVPIPGKGA